MATLRFSKALLTAAFICGATAPLTAQNAPPPVLASFARVRIQVQDDWQFAYAFGTKWHTGLVIGGISRCISVAPDSITVRDVNPAIPADEQVPLLAVSFDNISRVQVSALYDGRFVPGEGARVYERGADISAEEWVELSVDSIMRDPASCPPGQ